MSFEFYKLIHVVSALALFMALGASIIANKQGGKKIAVQHGVALLLMLIAGFGMLAKHHIGFPTWVIVKLVLWLILGYMVVLIKRMPEKQTVLWYATVVVGLFAVFLALYKP